MKPCAWRRRRRDNRRIGKPSRSSTSLRLEQLENRELLSVSAATYGQLPLAFEPNLGQTSAAVDYLARGPGYTVWLTPTESVLSLQSASAASGNVLSMELVGANAASVAQGQNQLAGVTNYLIGNPSQWLTNIPNYGQVTYQNVYPGINLVYYGQGQQLEYDFVVAPGASTSEIRLQVQGSSRMTLDAQGDLVLTTSGGTVIEKAPVVYQLVNGVKQNVAGRYVLMDNEGVGFAIGAHNASLPLVIDPALDYSTYLGGIGDDNANAIAVDAAGNAYITGGTQSLNFPTTSGAVQSSFGARSIFQSSNGGASWSAANNTLPGVNVQFLAVDPTSPSTVYAGSNGGVFKTTNGGASWSAANTGLPTLNITGLGIDLHSSQTLYATVNNPSGASVFTSTNGGANWTAITSGLPANFIPNSLTVDPVNSGTAYVDGTTLGSGGLFKTTNGGASWTETDSGLPNPSLAFTLAVAPSNSQTLYVDDQAPAGPGNVYKSTNGGSTWSATGANQDFFRLVVSPTDANTVYGVSSSGVYKSTNGGTSWSAIDSGLPGLPPSINSLAINSSNAQVLYAGTANNGVYETTNGGASWSAVNSGLVNPAINVVALAPSNPSVLYTGSASGSDAFVAKLNATGTALVYSTYLGGVGNDEGFAIAVDGAGTAFITGTTSSVDLPIVNGLQSSYPGAPTGFVARLNAAGNTLLYSSYLGGAASGGVAFPTGIATDGNGNVYVSGNTAATDFPTTSGAFQTAFGDKSFGANTNGGTSWATQAVGLPNALTNVLAVDPTNGSVLYAGTQGGIFKSTDQGAHWSALTSGLPGNYDATYLAINPTTTSTLFAGSSSGQGVFESTNGGAAWTLLNNGLPGNLAVTGLVINPSQPSTLYAAGNGSGVFESTNGGAFWSADNSGLPSLSVLSLAIAPSQPTTLYAGLDNSGDALAVSVNGGASWTGLSSIAGTQTSLVAVDPTSALTVYAVAGGSLAKSTDGGATFSPANTGLPNFFFNAQLAFDPTNHLTLYLAIGPDGLFKTTSGGGTWVPLTGTPNPNVQAVTVDPSNGARVYIGTDAGSDIFATKINTNASGQASLVYSTFIGGAGSDQTGGTTGVGNNIALDSSGDLVVTGSTDSGNFPTTAGTLGAGAFGATHAFVTKLNATGSGLVYSTYLAGSATDEGTAAAVDSAGNAYVTGFTFSSDFPTLHPFQASNNGFSNGNAVAFVSELSPSGSLLYSTYLGGSGGDQASGIVTDNQGAVYLTGFTRSSNFPIMSPFLPVLNGSEDAFVVKLNVSTNTLVYSSYLGGSSGGQEGRGIAIDSAGNAYVAGFTQATNFQLANALQTLNQGGLQGKDAFVAKVVLWHATNLAVDASNRTQLLWYVTGGTADIWALQGLNVTPSQVYAPYGQWQAVATAVGPDGLTRMLWTNPNGNAALWVIGSNGNVQNAAVFNLAGSTAANMVIGSDGQIRLLWINPNGAAALWLVNATTFAVVNKTSYGPIPGWTVRSMSAGSSDGFTRLLWTNTNGQAALWLVNASGTISSSDVLGPISGWTAELVAVDPNNLTHLVWANASGQITIWTITDSFSVTGAFVYGPVAGWSLTHIVIGADNIAHLLWVNPNGYSAIWDVNPDGSLKDAIVIGPL